MNDTLKRLPPPSNPDPSMWVDEAIWGHRLHDEQTPWLVYLEFINIFCYEESQGTALFESHGYNKLAYKPAKRPYLRNILFNNPNLDEICRVHSNDTARWKAWIKKMETVQGINNPNFSYLKDHFHSFEEFCHIVSIIRSTSLETDSNKRWTSKFVFPYGESSLYEDLDKKAKTNDRRFFGRTGEMLYLMLCRAKRRTELAKMLKEKTLHKDSVWDTIIRCLQPAGDDSDRSERANTFIPYESHPSFDKLAEDWLAILSLDMPGYDALPHLVNLAGLHLIHYQLTISEQVVNRGNPVTLVCEIVAPKKTLVRELSCETYQENNLLSTQAVTAYISGIINSEEWKSAILSHDPFIECLGILKENVLWPRRATDYEGPNNQDQLLADFRTAALRRHNQHVGNIHRVYGKNIGLVSRRGTNKLRYAPTDDLLKTLLFANIKKRMELHFFLQRLWDRYGIILGDKEGEKILPKDEFDKKAFQANSQRLEQRLLSLGLLNRLSDGCAYVVNPYYLRGKND
ncbi:MAG: hypothetical protein GY839_19430 [candidate division Zixibacteria bacterium]|nr:hypothetical protein [candidate division Zixibacteria bacterium]